MLFRFGEALATAGFECYSVDYAGHGESPQAYSLTNMLLNFQEFEQAFGAVDVFIGHSRLALSCCCRPWPSAESQLVAGRGVTETSRWPSLRVTSSGNSSTVLLKSEFKAA
jgi:hypothetical protein